MRRARLPLALSLAVLVAACSGGEQAAGGPGGPGGDGLGALEFVQRRLPKEVRDSFDIVAFDPQTSGGLLAAVDPAAVAGLTVPGSPFVVIGNVVAGTPGLRLV